MISWHVYLADADAVLRAAWELGEVRMGHLLVHARSAPTPWSWSCCCGLAGGYTGPWAHTALVLARFMTAHRRCVRLAAWEQEDTRPIAYQVEGLRGEATSTGTVDKGRHE